MKCMYLSNLKEFQCCRDALFYIFIVWHINPKTKIHTNSEVLHNNTVDPRLSEPLWTKIRKWIIDGRGQLPRSPHDWPTITCRGIFTMPVAFEQAFMVTLSLLALLPLTDHSKFSFISSPLRLLRDTLWRICITCAVLLLVFINNEYSYFARKFSSDNRGFG